MVDRRYLDTLRKREAATPAVKEAMDELAARLKQAGGTLVRRATVLKTVNPLLLRTISHLIARENVAKYEEAIRAVPGGREFRFLVIGPRAPYSFSALSDSGGAHGMNLAD